MSSSSQADESSPSSQIARALRELLATSPHVQAAMGRRLGIPPGDVAGVDHVVSAAEPIGPAELARLLDIRSASATAMVDRLEATGHLRRDAHPKDRRRVVLQASASGRRDIGAALRPLVGAIEEVVSDLSAEQARTVLEFLQQATAAMQDYARDEETTKGPRIVREPFGKS